MFWPQFLGIFIELISLCSLYVNLFGRSFTYMIKIIIKIELNSLRLVYNVDIK